MSYIIIVVVIDPSVDASCTGTVRVKQEEEAHYRVIVNEYLVRIIMV